MTVEQVILQGGIAGLTLFVLYKLGRGVLGLIVGALDRNTRAITRVEAKIDADRAYRVGRAPTEPALPPAGPEE